MCASCDVCVQFERCQKGSVSASTVLLQEVKPHLSVFTGGVAGLLRKVRLGIKDSVSLDVGDFVFVLHNFFLRVCIFQ